MKTQMNKTKILMTVMAVAVSLMMTACSSDKSSSGPVGGGVIGPHDCVGCPGYNQSNLYAEAFGENNNGGKEMGLTIYKNGNGIGAEGYMLIRNDIGSMCRLLNGEYDVVTVRPGQYDPASDQIFNMELALRHISLAEEIIVRVEYMSRVRPTTGGYHKAPNDVEYPFGLRAKLQVLDVVSGDAVRDRDCREYLNYGTIPIEFSPPQTAY